jgi:hypothetical protein
MRRLIVVRPVSEIIAAIERFQPTNGNWLELDALLDELFQSGTASQGINAMLGVFERFPKEDGAGVFWSIVHGLESMEGYERRLIESVRRAPSEFAMLMIHRLINAKNEEVDGVRLVSLLEHLAHDQMADSGSRRSANKYLGWHKA